MYCTVPVLDVYDGAGAAQPCGGERRESHRPLPVVRGPGADLLIPSQPLDLPLLRHVLAPRLVYHDLLQTEEGPVHVPVGEVLHLHVELDHLPADVAGPVGVEVGRDGVRLPAEAAQ